MKRIIRIFRNHYLALLLCFAFLRMGFSQSQIRGDWNEALRYVSLHQDSMAFLHMRNILKNDPNHVEALLQASKLASALGGKSKDFNTRNFYMQHALAYAQRSIEVVPGCKEAHLNYIVSLGLLSEMAKNPAEKLKHATIIKKEADYLITIDPFYPPAHFALGKWHLSIASLSWFEKAACNFLFGGLPDEASLETALRCFEKAIQWQPDCILFHYNKALALQKLGRPKEAIKTLEFSLSLPPQEPNDTIRKNNCITLLKKLGNHSNPL